MPDFQERCTVRPGLPGHGTTRATKVCQSIGGVDLRQFGPPDGHVRLPDKVHGEHESNQSSLVDSNPEGAPIIWLWKRA